MAIAESLISAFLSHQFQKERAEQESRQRQQQQRQQQQAQLQQALMMREVIGQQQEQQLQAQIADRQMRARETLENRKFQSESNRQLRKQLFEEAVQQRKLGLAEKETQFQRHRQVFMEEWGQKEKIRQADIAAGKRGEREAKYVEPPAPELLMKMYKFDPASRKFIIANDPTKSMEDWLAAGYRAYPAEDRRAVEELGAPAAAFNQLRDSWDALKKLNWARRVASKIPGVGSYITPEGAIYEKDATNFTSLFDRLIGGVRGGGSVMMQRIRRQILPDMTTNPKVGEVIMDQMEELIDTMIQNRTNAMLGFSVDRAKEETQASSLVSGYMKYKGTPRKPDKSLAELLSGAGISMTPGGE